MLYGRDGRVEQGLKNNLTCSLISVSIYTKFKKIKMYEWWVVLDNFPKKACHTRSCFFREIRHPIQFKMLKVGAALCQPRHHILFKREAFPSQFINGELF